MAKNSEYRGSFGPVATPKKKSATRKTIVTPGTKVSQATINSIKKLGMKEALKLAGKNGNPAGGLASEFQEGVKRMYGAKRLATAKATYAPVKPAAKSPDAARGAAGGTKPATKPAVKPAVKPVVKPAPKKGQSTSDKLKIVGGTVAGIGLLALGKGKGASAAAKLSPAVGKFAKSPVGKALFGTGEKLTEKTLSTSGRLAAKAGKPVSQTQYDAMLAAAKAKGIKLPAAAGAARGARAATAKATARTTAKSAAAARKTKVASGPDAARKAATSTSKKKLGAAGLGASGSAQTRK